MVTERFHMRITLHKQLITDWQKVNSQKLCCNHYQLDIFWNSSNSNGVRKGEEKVRGGGGVKNLPCERLKCTAN